MRVLSVGFVLHVHCILSLRVGLLFSVYQFARSQFERRLSCRVFSLPPFLDSKCLLVIIIIAVFPGVLFFCSNYFFLSSAYQ